MFREYFGIEENPFSNTPDPSYLFLSERHQEALAHLQYGVNGTSGFVLLTGEVGTGKTTVSRCLVEQLPGNIDLAMCLNPRLSEVELLATICDELAIERKDCAPDSVKDHMDALNRHLLQCHADGRRAVLIIDEAQNLSTLLLEQVRLLTNLETASTKLLQIILIGQPELRDIVGRNDMRQLSQRITARYHLDPMTRGEADKYIRHRLSVGKLPETLIPPAALSIIYDYSGGVPRLINSICERCLLGAYATNTKTIDASLVHTAAREVLGNPASKNGVGSAWLNRVVVAALAGLIVIGTVTLSQRDGDAMRAFAATVSKPEVATAAKLDPKPTPVAADTRPQPKLPPVATQSVTRVDAIDPSLKVVSRLIAEGLVTSSKPARKLSQVPIKQQPEKAAPPPAEPIQTAAVAPVIETRPDGPLTIETLFSRPDIRGHLDGGVAKLFRLWGHTTKPLSGLNPCADAEAQGLRCYRGQGPWPKLAALNHPALISLGKTDGARKYAVVTALDGSTVTLEAGGRKIVTDVQAIQDLWSGDFLVLWKPLASLRRNLRPGMSGRDVAWLKNRLGEILKIPSPEDGGAGSQKKEQDNFFGDDLKKRVIAFQQSHGLKVDGIVGTLTRIQLSAVIGSPNAPPLLKQP
ncbi:MAG: AAA family ATPase [Rhodospirillales bacterium]|nr:AAA family ATPase [Rhodospirillales bacterium]